MSTSKPAVLLFMDRYLQHCAQWPATGTKLEQNCQFRLWGSAAHKAISLEIRTAISSTNQNEHILEVNTQDICHARQQTHGIFF